MRYIFLVVVVSIPLIILYSVKFSAIDMIGVGFWGVLFFALAFRLYRHQEVIVAYFVLYITLPFIIPEKFSDPAFALIFGLIFFTPLSLASGYLIAKAFGFLESKLARRQSKASINLLRLASILILCILAILHGRRDFEHFKKQTLKNKLMGQYVVIAKMATDFPVKNFRDFFEHRDGANYHAANGLVEYKYNQDERTVTAVFHDIPAGETCYGLIYQNPNIVDPQKSIVTFKKFINDRELEGGLDSSALLQRCGINETKNRVDIKFIVAVTENLHLDLAEAKARNAEKYRVQKEAERLVAESKAQRKARHSERTIDRKIKPGNFEFEGHIFKTGNTLDVPLVKIRELSHDASLRGLVKKCEWSEIADQCQDLSMEGRVVCKDRAEDPPLDFEEKDWKRIEHDDFYVVQYGRLVAFWTISCQRAFPDGLKWRKR